MTALAVIGARLLGGVLRRAEPLAGGDLSQILRIELADGRIAIVKNGPAPQTEAAMLRSHRRGRRAGAQGAGGERRCAGDRGTAGRRQPAQRLGQPRRGARAAARNPGHALWLAGRLCLRAGAIENDVRRRLAALLGRAAALASVPHVPAPVARRVERLAADLADRLPARPEPALLHGDLWGGNVLVDGDHVSGLIDPACYFGHCEVDLAMLTLFDRPGPAFYDAYGALEPGAEERLVIYRLWPALVHLRLFGGGYRGMVEGMLAAAGV